MADERLYRYKSMRGPKVRLMNGERWRGRVRVEALTESVAVECWGGKYETFGVGTMPWVNPADLLPIVDDAT